MAPVGAAVGACGPPAVTLAVEQWATHTATNETAQGDDSPHTHQEFNSEPLPNPDSSVVRTLGPSFSSVPGLAIPGAAVPGNPETAPLLT